MIDDASQMMSHVTSVTEAPLLAQSVTMTTPRNARTVIVEDVIGVPLQTGVWILGRNHDSINTIVDTQLTVIIAVHLRSEIKMIVNQALAIRARTFSSLASIHVSLKQRCLVCLRSTAMWKVVRS